MHIAFSVIICQENYRSIEQIESEWGDYTKFQRDEMISFCDFLFNEGYYERCLISSFQFLYRLPDDPVKPALLYLIARSYEEMGNYSLSKRYYTRVMNIESKTSKAYQAANYRNLYCDLMEGNLDAVFSTTQNSTDPYYLMLRGYCYLKELDWENARATFISAEEIFNDKHYSKLMIPLYQSIDDVSLIKQHSKVKVALSGLIFPGGGQLALKDKKNVVIHNIKKMWGLGTPDDLENFKISEKFNFQKINDKYEEKNYEQNIKRNLANSISQKLMLKLAMNQ